MRPALSDRAYGALIVAWLCLPLPLATLCLVGFVFRGEVIALPLAILCAAVFVRLHHVLESD